ncbi:MAG: sugar transferase [Myxococcota bacterium]
MVDAVREDLTPVPFEHEPSSWHVLMSGEGKPVPNLYLARTSRLPSLRGLTPQKLDAALAERGRIELQPSERVVAVWVRNGESTRAVEQVREGENGVEVAPSVETEVQTPRVPRSVRLLKRALDVMAASSVLLLTWPVMVLVAIGIKLESKGPAIFSQERIGSGNKPFTMYKFRSMRSDAETASGPVWAKANDNRITPLGRVLRKARLDELPQLFNVLRGDMSLVGPRPERRFFIDQLEKQVPAYNERLSHCKPGITGWAQINLPYDTSIESVKTKVLYDLAYGAHMYSVGEYIRMEARIILRTFGVLIWGKGAH